MTTGIEEAAASKAISFLGKILPQPINELGLIVSDNIKLWRWKNQIAIMEKAEAFLKEKNIPVKKVSPKQILPLLEYAAKEDEPEMQLLWANLLVNTVRANGNFDNTILVKLLSEMSTQDAKLLEYIWNFFGNESSAKGMITTEQIIKHFSDSSVYISIENVLRLRLCCEPFTYSAFVFATETVDERRFSLTALGHAFMQVVHGEQINYKKLETPKL